MRGRIPIWLRFVVYVSVVVCLVFLGVVALIHFRQHSMIYHPRPYDATYAHSLPADGIEISYMLPIGKQTAYYIPGRDPLPRRLWIAFCGNGSLALDWTTILAGYPKNADAFLLVDYPGYGKNSGYATIDSTRATAEAALRELTGRLHISEKQPVLCVIGHSLGAAAAFDFAAHHRVERIVAIAPFTTLREEAATVVGRPLARLLIENYDNEKKLAEIARRNPSVRVAIFHGVEDDVIPVRMGRELAQRFRFIDFFPIAAGDHVSVLTTEREKIINWMNP
jgi:pimeloyl-ACP methyl ester carboxylesterase